MTRFRILAINPGSTSTKLAAFTDGHAEWAATIRHADSDLSQFDGSVLAQLPYRLDALERCLREQHAADVRWSGVVGRGGLLPPMPSGTYVVDDAMLAQLRAAARGEHASNLGAFLAHAVAERTGCRALVVDPVSVDELDDVARLSGLAGLDRECLSHALNTRAVARRHASATGKRYEQLRLIIAHLGSGISVSAHRDGLMVDVNNSRDEGPFSTERAGSVPTLPLVQRAIRESWSVEEAERRLFREGGVYSYLGTRDIEAVVSSSAHDARAALVLDAMVYQIAKEIGALAAVLDGRVDAILLTGGMAHSAFITENVTVKVNWIAPVHVYPGEDEMRALAEGALSYLAESSD